MSAAEVSTVTVSASEPVYISVTCKVAAPSTTSVTVPSNAVSCARRFSTLGAMHRPPEAAGTVSSRGCDCDCADSVGEESLGGAAVSSPTPQPASSAALAIVVATPVQRDIFVLQDRVEPLFHTDQTPPSA